MKYYKISSDRLLVVLDSVKRTISTSKTMDDCTFSRLYNDVNWLFEIGYIDASTVPEEAIVCLMLFKTINRRSLEIL